MRASLPTLTARLSLVVTMTLFCAMPFAGTAAAQSAAPSTAIQPGDVGCGTDIDCFAQQAASCTPSAVSYTVTLDLAPLAGLTSGLVSSTTDSMRLAPDAPGASTCRLAFVVEKVDMQILPAAIKELTDLDVDPALFDQLQKGIADANRTIEGRWAACQFAPHDLATMLGDWSRGHYSTEDFSTASSCSGTYFGNST